MKFSENWLRKWVNPPISTEELVAQLSMAGLEVDSSEPVAEKFTGVVVGEVLSVEPHQDAKKLNICSVDIGEEKPLNIVCGAVNVEKGIKVPVAKVGALLPGELSIKKTALRGVESEGMLCSAKEIGLDDGVDGLMILPADSMPGVDIRSYFQLDDVCIELDLTPNRGDCLSIAGVAREVSVLNQCPIKYPSIKEVSATIGDTLPIEIIAPEDCPRYVGRVIKGINSRASTPLWMQEKLRRSGLRSVSPVVDVTNYVLLELGQPMHAFDLDKLDKGIVVRKANEKEEITLLDGQRLTLNEQTLVIADHANPQAIAGVMGGAHAAVGESSKNIFLESAYFSPQFIAGRARSYGLHTDSSHRFERGVDPELQKQAVERATSLLLDIVGGKAGPVTDIRSNTDMPKQPSILLRRDRVKRILGVDVPEDDVREMLRRLGMLLTEVDSGWEVSPPSFRSDISLEIDLIEEIIRIHGYHQIPGVLPDANLVMRPRPEGQVTSKAVCEAVINRGYQETINYSFVDPKIQALFGDTLSKDKAEAVPLVNPISSDMAVMRTSLLPGLVMALIHNQNRQQNRVKLFEIGLKFSLQSADYTQEKVIAGVVCGSVNPEQWGEQSQVIDFYDCKADVEAVLSLRDPEGKFKFIKDEEHPSFHPGQCARIERGTDIIGWVGAIHPAIEQALGITGTAYVFELNFASIEARTVPIFAETSKFPSVRRDLAVVIDEKVNFSELYECIFDTTSDTLRNVQVFDVYRGKGIDSGRKSLALGLTFQDLKRTLNDTDVDNIMGQIMSSLNNNLGATLRH